MSKHTAKERLEALEAAFTALAHASRRQILMTVHFRDGMTAGDIAARFHHAWPTISRHLGVLKSAGLLTEERHGRTRLYRVNHEQLANPGESHVPQQQEAHRCRSEGAPCVRTRVPGRAHEEPRGPATSTWRSRTRRLPI